MTERVSWMGCIEGYLPDATEIRQTHIAEVTAALCACASISQVSIQTKLLLTMNMIATTTEPLVNTRLEVCEGHTHPSAPSSRNPDRASRLGSASWQPPPLPSSVSFAALSSRRHLERLLFYRSWPISLPLLALPAFRLDSHCTFYPHAMAHCMSYKSCDRKPGK
jgi:hypothetical protein